MTSDEETIMNHGEEYHLTEDEEHMLFKSEQFFGKKKEHDSLIISKQLMFNYWEEMYEELNGNPNTLKNLKTCFLKNIRKSNYDVLCVPIIHEIKKLQGGTSKVFEYYITKDTMECTHLKVANIFNHITQGNYIRRQNKKESDKKSPYLQV